MAQAEQSGDCMAPCSSQRESIPSPHKYAPVAMEPIKKSMSFLTVADLLSYKFIPAASTAMYMGTALGTMAHCETLVQCFGSEYRAAILLNAMTGLSIFGHACYIYGRRHIRHAGAFEKIIYPIFSAVAFNCGSHFLWATMKVFIFKEQSYFDYHWRILGGFLSGLTLLYTGRSYLKFIDHW